MGRKGKVSRVGRKLPREILSDPSSVPYHLEAQAVRDKFSDPKARVCDHNTDHVAFIYMVPEAVLFWMPRFIDFLKTEADADSYHFHALIYLLSRSEFAEPLLKVASPDELRSVVEYLDWWEEQLLPADKSAYGPDLKSARMLWVQAVKQT